MSVLCINVKAASIKAETSDLRSSWRIFLLRGPSPTPSPQTVCGRDSRRSFQLLFREVRSPRNLPSNHTIQKCILGNISLLSCCDSGLCSSPTETFEGLNFCLQTPVLCSSSTNILKYLHSWRGHV